MVIGFWPVQANLWSTSLLNVTSLPKEVFGDIIQEGLGDRKNSVNMLHVCTSTCRKLDGSPKIKNNIANKIGTSILSGYLQWNHHLLSHSSYWTNETRCD